MNTDFTKTASASASRLLDALRRRWWVIPITVALAIGVAHLILQRVTPVFMSTATVVISPQTPRIMADFKDVVDAPGAGAGIRWFDDYKETQLDIIAGVDVATAVLDELDLWGDPRLFEHVKDDTSIPVEVRQRELASSLASRIEARAVPNSLTVQIGFSHPDARLAADIVNATARQYEEFNLKLRQDILDRAGVELNTLLESRRRARDGAAEAVRAFEREHDIAAIDVRADEVSKERAFYNDRILESDAKVIRVSAEVERARKARGQGVFGIGVSDVVGQGLLDQLKIQYAAAQAVMFDLKLVYGPKHNKLRSARSRVKHLRKAVGSEVEASYQSARARKHSATAEHKEYVSKFEAARLESEVLLKQVREHKKLQEEAKNQSEIYDRIRKRYDETVISNSLAGAANNVRVLEEALIPKVPVWPRRGLTMFGASFLGLLIGAGFILLLDQSDTTVRNKDDVEEALGLPCLGLIPTIESPQGTNAREAARRRDFYIFDNSMSDAAEQARTLRANLLFMSAERRLKTLLVSSALPSEGKTTISFQTALTLAAAGSKTVLIEADMRRPRLATTLNIDESVGLSTYLCGTDETLPVHQTEVGNLSVIVCGPVPPNPTELLNSLRLNKLIAKLHESFDLVIIDSPPVNAVSDALVVASRVDGVLLVVKQLQTPSEAILSARDALSRVNAPLIGAVLNDVRRGPKGYYKKGYYYRRYYRHEPEDALDDDRDEDLLAKNG